MADEKLRSYRRHSEKPWELEPELSEHRSAMTTEALHSKAEIAEEFAVRDRKIAALEARAEKAEQEHEDTVPARTHEELRQVMLGERRRAEKAERERDELRETIVKINAIRDSIVGLQTVNWSEHVYPLVDILESAGFAGLSYEESRTRFGTMLERTLAAENESAISCSERDAALARELEVDAEELAAFRWLKCWCEERGRMLRFALGNRIGIVGLDGDTWQLTPVALATALDPNWRKAGSKKD